MTINGAPIWLALLCAMIAGMLAGFVTGFFHTFCGIPAIVSWRTSTQLALYALRIMGFGTGGGKEILPVSV